MKRLMIVSGLAFLVGSYETGMTRQCVYEYLGDRYTVTIKSYQICPQTINI